MAASSEYEFTFKDLDEKWMPFALSLDSIEFVMPPLDDIYANTSYAHLYDRLEDAKEIRESLQPLNEKLYPFPLHFNEDSQSWELKHYGREKNPPLTELLQSMEAHTIRSHTELVPLAIEENISVSLTNDRKMSYVHVYKASLQTKSRKASVAVKIQPLIPVEYLKQLSKIMREYMRIWNTHRDPDMSVLSKKKVEKYKERLLKTCLGNSVIGAISLNSKRTSVVLEQKLKELVVLLQKIDEMINSNENTAVIEAITTFAASALVEKGRSLAHQLAYGCYVTKQRRVLIPVDEQIFIDIPIMILVTERLGSGHSFDGMFSVAPSDRYAFYRYQYGTTILFKDEVFKAHMTQLLFALCSMQSFFGLTHNDLHFGNIQLEKTNITYLRYRISTPIQDMEQMTLLVPTFGYIVKIIDFGRSEFATGLQIDEYGTFKTTQEMLHYASVHYKHMKGVYDEYDESYSYDKTQPRVHEYKPHDYGDDLRRVGKFLHTIYEDIQKNHIEYPDAAQIAKQSVNTRHYTTPFLKYFIDFVLQCSRKDSSSYNLLDLFKDCLLEKNVPNPIPVDPMHIALQHIHNSTQCLDAAYNMFPRTQSRKACTNSIPYNVVQNSFELFQKNQANIDASEDAWESHKQISVLEYLTKIPEYEDLVFDIYPPLGYDEITSSDTESGIDTLFTSNTSSVSPSFSSSSSGEPFGLSDVLESEE